MSSMKGCKLLAVVEKPPKKGNSDRLESRLPVSLPEMVYVL
jgi:hypothetical protein